MDKLGHEHTSDTAAAFKAKMGFLLLVTFVSHHALRMASDVMLLTTPGVSLGSCDSNTLAYVKLRRDAEKGSLWSAL